MTPNLAIPDQDRTGIRSTINIDKAGAIAAVEKISVDITHTYRGDLFVSLISPNNTVIKLHQGQGGTANDLIHAYDLGTTPDLQQLDGEEIQGTWILRVEDRWKGDTGTLNRWGLKLRVRTSEARVTGTSAPGQKIPDDDPNGIVDTIQIAAPGKVKDVQVAVNISHTYVQDLTVKLMAPSRKTVTLHNRTGGSSDDIQQTYTLTSHPHLAQLLGESIAGAWTLAIMDQAGLDTGKLNQWDLSLLG
ncbi:MAG: proprotein convertase P-domain-containing protein [Cyanobacteria bacterium J06629_9]